MKKNISIPIIILIIIILFSGNIIAQTQKESLNMLIDISPYVTLDIGDDINITIDQPWQGGEVRETSSKLYIKTNTEVELSWESTSLNNEKTGRSLPLGIPADFIQKLIRGEKVEASEQAFGLNSFLVKTRIEQKTYDRYVQREENDNSILNSVVKNGERLVSQHSYKLDPGIHNFDLIIQYYWAKEGSWSQIIAGQYTGEIIYTVSAVEDGTE
jgi:hypothetical protein